MPTPYSIVIDDDYIVPKGHLDAAQYVTYVMNMAAKSYQSQYKTASEQEGIEAACAAYNATIVLEPEPRVGGEG